MRAALAMLLFVSLVHARPSPSPKPRAYDGEWNDLFARNPSPQPLLARQIIAGMQPAKRLADDCYKKWKVAGLVKVGITVEPDGRLRGVHALGVHVGTATGDCVVDAVRTSARFSALDTREPYRFEWMFMLR